MTALTVLKNNFFSFFKDDSPRPPLLEFTKRLCNSEQYLIYTLIEISAALPPNILLPQTRAQFSGPN